MKITRVQAQVFPWITKLRKRLPASFCQWLFQAIPKSRREESLFEESVRFSKEIGWPATYSLDPRLKRKLTEISMLAYFGPGSEKLFNISNATLLPDGIIVQSSRIHPSSSLYSRLTPEMKLKAAQQFFAKTIRPTVKSATMIPRQLVDSGTYGDYIIEFLLPLVNVYKKITTTLILDTAYIHKYAANDLTSLNILEARTIPPGGLDVETLTIVPPCQPFSHFQKSNLDALAAAFPIEEDFREESGRRVYLSRLGFSNASAPKQYRSIENEKEVEAFLESKGFLILRPDRGNNQVVRETLSRASFIIFNHGSAAFHLAWGMPKTVIELACEDWWNPAFLRLSRGLNVESHRVLQTEGRKVNLEELDSCIKAADSSNPITEMAGASSHTAGSARLRKI